MLGLAGLGVLASLAAAALDPSPLLVWNVTASAPRGLYFVLPARALKVGDLALLRLDPALATLFDQRGYLPQGVPLLKRVAAVGGTPICVRNDAVYVADRHVLDVAPTDGSGRPLTPWTGCRPLADDEIFVLNPAIRGSLDGRYFGPSPLRSVIGRAIPIWTRAGG